MPEQDYGAFQGKSVTFTGKVYARETSLREQEEIQVLYLKQEKENADHSTAPPGERVICYLKAGEEEPELGSVVKVKGKLSAFEKASNPGQFDACSYYQILKREECGNSPRGSRRNFRRLPDNSPRCHSQYKYSPPALHPGK